MYETDLSSFSFACRNADEFVGLETLVHLCAICHRKSCLDKVIVDVGTGYFVEKSRPDAKIFYEAKVKELGENLGKLEAVVRQKSESLNIIEDGLRQKILAQQGQGGGQAATAS